jgi:hypothetical protein
MTKRGYIGSRLRVGRLGLTPAAVKKTATYNYAP